jgi:hypothetical protein
LLAQGTRHVTSIALGHSANAVVWLQPTLTSTKTIDEHINYSDRGCLPILRHIRIEDSNNCPQQILRGNVRTDLAGLDATGEK